ncbi:hypothetical protein SUNI508_13322 [Seiridium unicorne]|uniref:Uncharacterized protein n=1 Tax=Seiridium unicorne TaxID=138068 RepID=A0ABR2VDE1_9PEZI
MAHLAKHLSQPAIFSPSVARAAASTAKDWSYIDGWLKIKFKGQKVPPFERNADTLKALLALAAHNEAADEERDQLARIEAAALEEVKAAEADTAKRREAYEAAGGQDALNGEFIADDLVQAINNSLTKDGSVALDSMASMAVEIGMAYPTPEELGCKFVELQARVFELEQTTERVGLLQKYLDRQSVTVDDFLEELHGQEYQPTDDLAKKNLELQRQVKAMAAQLPELYQQVASLETAVGPPSLTVEEVRKDEEGYLDLLAKKKDLDAQVKAFAGLPPDIEAARAELEALRAELRIATQRRDAGWEGLVERESPFKPRTRRPL